MVARRPPELDALPRLGWVDSPSPVEPLADVARELGLDGLWVKRDDLLATERGLHGGTKLRKLDVLLAASPFRESARWASVGAIGSGHLVALSSAARVLGRELVAHVFWEPPLPDHLENLAFVASGPGRLRFFGSRASLALTAPSVLLASRSGDAAVVPPGASAPAGELGVVRGALELVEQISAGALPAPSHLFVPIGSGGTVVGLLAGMALGGVACVVHGVAVVERVFARHGALLARARRLLTTLGAADARLPELRIHRRELGDGYGVATARSLAMCARFSSAGLPLEAVYSGKAMAGLFAAARELRGPVLFWSTPRRSGPLPVVDGWRARLPASLRRRLDDHDHPRLLTRRRVLVAGTAALGAAVIARSTGYPTPPPGLEVLGRGAAGVLRAAIEVVVSPPPASDVVDDMLTRIDRFVMTQPWEIRAQIDGALTLVEQTTFATVGTVGRFSSLSAEGRGRALDALVEKGGVAVEAGRAVRDLVMLGFYQRPASWERLGYSGPWVTSARRADPYAALVATAPPPGFEARR